MNTIEVQENTAAGGILAKISGTIELEDVENFKQKLLALIMEKFHNTPFTLLLDTRGYEPQSPGIHKEYSIFLKTTAQITNNCKAVAHVHHSQKHIDDLLPLMDEHQGFFTDINEAQRWLIKRK